MFSPAYVAKSVTPYPCTWISRDDIDKLATPPRNSVCLGLIVAQESGNKISRRAVIEGKQNIMLGGKSVVMAGTCLRGDLFRRPDKSAGDEKEGSATAIAIGRYVKLLINITIRP